MFMHSYWPIYPVGFVLTEEGVGMSDHIYQRLRCQESPRRGAESVQCVFMGANVVRFAVAKVVIGQVCRLSNTVMLNWQIMSYNYGRGACT